MAFTSGTGAGASAAPAQGQHDRVGVEPLVDVVDVLGDVVLELEPERDRLGHVDRRTREPVAREQEAVLVVRPGSAGVGVALALPAATLLPSVRRTKPVVTTRSSASRPLLTTVWISSCFCTTIGRMATELSSLTT